MSKMNLWGTLITSIMVLIMMYGTLSEAASFDCTKAQTQLEKTICGDSQLDEADTKLGKVYFELIGSLPGGDADKLKQEQRDWLKTRTNSCSSTDAMCLVKVYEERISVLQSKLSPPMEHSQGENFRIEKITQKIHTSLPLIDFKIFWNDDTAWNSEIVKIEIYDSQTSKLLQRLTNLEKSYCWAISFDDYNFDGFMDMRLSDLGAVLGNIHGDVYLFDPTTQEYMVHEGLSNLTSIQVDHEKKELYSTSQSSGGMEVIYEALTFIDDKLVVLSTSDSLSDDESGEPGDAEVEELLSKYRDNPEILKFLEKEEIDINIFLKDGVLKFQSFAEVRNRYNLTKEYSGQYCNPEIVRKIGWTGFGYSEAASPLQKGIYCAQQTDGRLWGLSKCLGVIDAKKQKVDTFELCRTFHAKYPGGRLIAFEGGRCLVDYSVYYKENYFLVQFEANIHSMSEERDRGKLLFPYATNAVVDILVQHADDMVERQIREIREKARKEQQHQNAVEQLKDSF